MEVSIRFAKKLKISLTITSRGGLETKSTSVIKTIFSFEGKELRISKAMSRTSDTFGIPACFKAFKLKSSRTENPVACQRFVSENTNNQDPKVIYLYL